MKEAKKADSVAPGTCDHASTHSAYFDKGYRFCPYCGEKIELYRNCPTCGKRFFSVKAFRFHAIKELNQDCLMCNGERSIKRSMKYLGHSRELDLRFFECSIHGIFAKDRRRAVTNVSYMSAEVKEAVTLAIKEQSTNGETDNEDNHTDPVP